MNTPALISYACAFSHDFSGAGRTIKVPGIVKPVTPARLRRVRADFLAAVSPALRRAIVRTRGTKDYDGTILGAINYLRNKQGRARKAAIKAGLDPAGLTRAFDALLRTTKGA